MDLAGERDRRQRERGEHEPPPLEREQHRGQEERDLPEQMARALLHAVRREREQHAAEQRGRAREPERAKPPAREATRREERQQQHEVVRPGGARTPARAARTACRTASPAGSAARRDSGWNEYGSSQGACAVLELVSGKPVVPDELQVVARRLLAVARAPSRRGSGRRRGATAGHVATTKQATKTARATRTKRRRSPRPRPASRCPASMRPAPYRPRAGRRSAPRRASRRRSTSTPKARVASPSQSERIGTASSTPERLGPRAMRPGGVHRDRDGPDPGGCEIVAPVTQEHQLVGSGRRPVPEVEAEEHRSRRRAPPRAALRPRGAPSRPELRERRPPTAEHRHDATRPAFDPWKRPRPELRRHVRDGLDLASVGPHEDPLIGLREPDEQPAAVR